MLLNSAVFDLSPYWQGFLFWRNRCVVGCDTSVEFQYHPELFYQMIQKEVDLAILCV